MKLTLPLNIPALPRQISYSDKLILIGSCFTEHMAIRLEKCKLKVLSNPHGILFNPLSVAHSLNSYVSNQKYSDNDLFYLNELWNSWDHHTRFSDTDKESALMKINESQETGSYNIRNATWLMITLGSAFQYYLKESGRPVANNHRAPAQWFDKKLIEIPEIISSLKQSMENILSINPAINFLFTISPVRHIRDGVVDNNRSKARLIESVHALCHQFPQAYYFPAYELVIDVLRDYRFYDIDFVHPNFLATQVVWEKFSESVIDPAALLISKDVEEIIMAKNHKTRFPKTNAHKSFMAGYAEKIKSLVEKHPFLDLKDELEYFESA
jgi:hypothetical protein